MFTWLKQWMRNVWRSATDAKFYGEVSKLPPSRGVRHLYGVLWLVSFLWAVFIAVWLVISAPLMRSGINFAKEVLPTVYPAELVVQVQTGAVVTNVKEPYSIDIPPRVANLLSPDAPEFLPHLLTIDTKGSVENYSSYDSIALLTKNSIAFPDRNGGLRVITLDRAMNMTIDKKFVDDGIVKIFSFVDLIPGTIVTVALPLLLIVAPFVFAAFSLLWYFAYLLLATFLLWILLMIMKLKRGYGELYKLSLYGLTLPLVYRLLETVLHFHYSGVFTVIYLVWMAQVMRMVHKPATKKK